MIGRDREQKRLLEHLDSARTGSGGVLILSGEPGVGKSVLLSFAAAAAQPDFTVLEAAGVESESELPFAGLQMLLQPVTDLLDQLPTPRAAALRGAVGLAPAVSDDRLAIYVALMDLLVAAARNAPVLVVVDDLHWLDGASRDAVLFAARRASSAPLAVLVAVRTEHLAALDDPPIERLTIPGLPEEAGVRLASSARGGLAPAVARELQAATDGNPLALVEIPALLSEAQASGSAPLDDPVPAGPRLQRVFTGRFAGMPSETRRALLIAAASHTGSANVVGAASRALGIDDDRALDPAEEAGLITVREGMIGWRHPLLRAAVYHTASRPERRAAHRALAQAGGDERLGDHRAWHLAAASSVADEEVARELEELAARARARGAFSTTARALRGAASLTLDEDERARRLIAAAEAASAIGSWADATALVAEAQQRTSALLLHAQATRVLARVELLQGLPDAAHARLVSAAEAVKDVEPALAATMMAEAVVPHMATGRWDIYQQTATRALDLGRKAGGAMEAIAALVLAPQRMVAGDTAYALELFSKYGPITREQQLWRSAPEAVAMFALCHIWLERFEVAEPLLDALIEFAQRTAALGSLAYPLAVRAQGHFRRGRWPAAYRDATESVSLARELPGGALVATNVSYLSLIEAGLGDVESARAHADEALELAQSLSLGATAPWALDAMGLLDLSIGDYEGTIRHVRRADPKVIAGENDPGVRLRAPLLIEAYARTANVEAARAEIEKLQHWSQITGRSLGYARAARGRGLIAPDHQIEHHFEEALDWHRRVDLPFERAWTQLCYGERLRRAQRRTAARAQLTAAADTFRALGAELWLRRAEAELQAAGSRRPAREHPVGWGELTKQERRVAQLIIDGATYREAADELFLSVRTVESHLRQIYRKLGVRSRTELTRKLSRQITPVDDAGAERPRA